MTILESIRNAVFGLPTIALLAFSGIFFTVKTKGFHLRNKKLIFRTTFLCLFKSDSRKSSDGRISKLQSASAALAATIGTGSLAGVASALTVGGRGALFWMWISALLGMATAYAEGVLSVKHRSRYGAASYISKGLKSKKASLVYSLLTVGAALGMGCAVQTSCISEAASQAFSLPQVITAIAVTILTAAVAFGGIKHMSSVAQRLVPAAAVLYLAGCCAALIKFRQNLFPCLCDVFNEAFGIRAAAGGAVGYSVLKAISVGFGRGVFSNEAGLGTTAAVHADSQTDEPVEQGMWNIFEVCTDTMVISTLTAAAIMSSGADKASLSAGQTLTEAFCRAFGSGGQAFAAVCLSLFALSTVLGWSVIGERAFCHVFGHSRRAIFCTVYSLAAFLGCLGSSETAFVLSDIFNGLMAYPNLAALFMLSGEVSSETSAYRRRLKEPSVHDV